MDKKFGYNGKYDKMIYVLKCSNDKYYVCYIYCSKPIKLDKMIDLIPEESKFLIKNKPIDLLDVDYDYDDCVNTIFEYMDKYGVENVMGGMWDDLFSDKLCSSDQLVNCDFSEFTHDELLQYLDNKININVNDNKIKDLFCLLEKYNTLNNQIYELSLANTNNVIKIVKKYGIIDMDFNNIKPSQVKLLVLATQHFNMKKNIELSLLKQKHSKYATSDAIEQDIELLYLDNIKLLRLKNDLIKHISIGSPYI